jgi:hypothetical protein
MTRAREFRPRCHAVLAVLLACAQLGSLVGMPTIARNAGRSGGCAGGACGCRTEADRSDKSCCCSTARRSIVVEPKSCCTSSSGSKTCCAKPETKIELVWVVGMNAKGCKSKHSPAGIPVEPSIPPRAPDRPMPFPERSEPLLARQDIPSVRPSLPPDPPPRVPV